MKSTDSLPTDLPHVTAEDVARAFRRLLGLRFLPRRLRPRSYSQAPHRGDGWDDWRLARAADKRARRAQRNLRNAR